MDESHPDWAPTQHLGHSEVTATVSDRHGRRKHRHRLRESEGGGQCEQNNMSDDERDVVQEHAEEEGDVDQADAGAAEEEEEHGDQAEAGAVEEEEYSEQTETDRPAAKRLRVECQFCEQSSGELNRVLQENRELRSELNKLKMDEEFFRDNTEKVRYYTGLPCFAFCCQCLLLLSPSFLFQRSCHNFKWSYLHSFV